MIAGVGIDILDRERVERLFHRFGSRFSRRLLSERERQDFSAIADVARQVSFLAKRFCAKEAFAKALHTGIRPPILLPRLSVATGAGGAPYLLWDEAVGHYLAERNITHCHLSFADERRYVQSVVVLEARND